MPHGNQGAFVHAFRFKTAHQVIKVFLAPFFRVRAAEAHEATLRMNPFGAPGGGVQPRREAGPLAAGEEGMAARQPGARGIQVDVVNDGGKVVGVVRFHHHCVVAARKEVAAHAVARVETLGIGGLQPFHAVHQIGPGSLEEKVVMVGHQRVGVNGPAASSGSLLERPQKRLSVFIVQVDRVSAVAFALHVVNRSGVFDSQGPAHAGRVADGGGNARLL